jgi:uncharacterized alkaline shock family protein YloU
VADPSDPSDRGSLELTPRVVTRIAEQTALQVRHVVRRSEGLNRLVGRSMPRVSASIDRDRVRLQLDIAVHWPCPLEEVAVEVRDHVAAETARLTGLSVRSADVTLHAVADDPDAAAESTRRVR